MDRKKDELNNGDLHKLEKIGLKKISDETHIVISELKAIINKDFDKLNRTKAIGFAKILEREYKLDLNQWKKEYEDYIKQKKKDEQQELFVAVKNDGSEERENRLFLIIGVIALIIIAYGTYYFFNNYQNSMTKTVTKEPSTAVIKEQKNSIVPKTEINTTQIEQNKTVLLPKENNETNETNETNQSNEINDEKIDENISKEKNVTVESFIISPRSKLWAGVIFLDDFSKKQFLTDANITLDPSRDFLMITGHGKFDIYLGDQKYHYDEGGKMRLLYKEGTLDTIDAQMFKTLNRGKAW